MGLARRAGVTRDAEHVYAAVTGDDDRDGGRSALGLWPPRVIARVWRPSVKLGARRRR